MAGRDTPPAFGLSFDPRAITDIHQAPDKIQNLVLAQIRDLVEARLFGLRLVGDLKGYRKLYVDPDNAWRVVYTRRQAPPESAQRAEIHVVAVRPRAGGDAYDTARQRLGISRAPASALAHAARTRSPQLSVSSPALPGTGRPQNAPVGPRGVPANRTSGHSL